MKDLTLILRLILRPDPNSHANSQGVQRGESVALNELPNADLGKPISYQCRLESNSALQATGQKGVRLWGGSGNDIIYGAADNDKLYGDADNDVLVGFGGDDELYGGAAITPYQHTTNSIALQVDNTPAKCSKGFKNRAKTSKPRCRTRNYPQNKPVAVIESAWSAIESVVTSYSSNPIHEVQHG